MKPADIGANTEGSVAETLELQNVSPAARLPKLYSIYLIRYVPDLLRSEETTIGVLAYEPETRYLRARFEIVIEVIRELHPHADMEYLAELPADFDRQTREHQNNPEYFLGWVKTFSNLIQIAEPQFCWMNDPEVELEGLLARHTSRPVTVPTPPAG